MPKQPLDQGVGEGENFANSSKNGNGFNPQRVVSDILCGIKHLTLQWLEFMVVYGNSYSKIFACHILKWFSHDQYFLFEL